MKLGFYCKSQNTRSGFTLLELSVVILILGTMLAAVATGYKSYKLEKDLEVTKERTTKVAEKLDEYRRIKGYYPCPASLSVARNDASYGAEALNSPRTATEGICANVASPGTLTSAGVTTQNSVGSAGLIQIGAIPFRELNISEEETYDAYGSRLVYAVTKGQTRNKDTFKENEGGIAITNNTGTSLVDPVASAHYLLLSPGKNRLGGFTMNGTSPVACSGSTADTNNCDFLNGQAEARFNINPYSGATNNNVPTADYFDDIAAFSVPKERSLWQRASETGTGINDLVDMSEANIVMASQRTAASADAALSILYDSTNKDVYDGSLFVSQNLMTREVCSATNPSGACLNVDNFAPGCPPNQYVIGINNGSIQCSVVNFGCPDPSQYLRGVNPDGTPDCAPVPPPIPGACGPADTDNVLLTSQPAPAALCINNGTPTAVTGNGYPWRWDCRGANYGSRVSCEAEMVTPVNGRCGSANGQSYAPNSTLDQPTMCSSGSVANMSGSGPWTWSCTGSPVQGSVAAGSTANCSANVTATNGQCGSNIDTCITGTFQSVADSPTQSLWSCLGSGGGTTQSCSSGLACTPGPTVPTTCNSGEYYVTQWQGQNLAPGNAVNTCRGYCRDALGCSTSYVVKDKDTGQIQGCGCNL